MKRTAFFVLLLAMIAVSVFAAGKKEEEISSAEADALSQSGLSELLAKTVTKPYKKQDFTPGKVAGTWNGTVRADPKSFNLQIAERDAETNSILAMMTDYLFEYRASVREWKPRVASYEIVTDEAAGTLKLICTLRDDLYWSYYNSTRKVPVTSDDVIFWYNDIIGDPGFNSSGYNSQFVEMPDGSESHVDIQRIDDKKFAFLFPRIVAEPLLSVNMDFGPKHVYEPAKQAGGVEGVLNILSVAEDPTTIPSMGQWFLVEYTPGQRLVYKRNPDYWNKDANGVAIPYISEEVDKIVADENTQKLLFQQGQRDYYTLRPEDVDEIINAKNPSYTVFNAEGQLGASLWSFNQNPQNKGTAYYEWFTRKEFRQAMSCILNRDRLNSQVYRGLAEPTYYFFPPANPYYNADITLQYRYDLKKAEQLLASIGIQRDSQGVMRDWSNRAIEFDLSISADVQITADTANIIMDEAAKLGIKVNIRVTDFQKIVEQLTSTYDWQAVLISLGTIYFPTQGSNVWPSTGNLHLWYPLQEKPATEWEARVDHLYNEGKYTVDHAKAKVIWDEYQSIILEQCPVIYLMRQRTFFGIQNRWDFTNLYYDNLDGVEMEHLYLKQ